MKKTVFIALLLTCVAVHGAKISLKEAVKNGIEKDLGFKNSQLDLSEGELEELNAKMKRFFALDFQGGYMYKSLQPEISQPDTILGQGTVIPGYTKPLGSKHIFDFSISLKQPLFTGNILSNGIRLKEVELAMKLKAVELRSLDAASRVKVSFFLYRFARNRIDAKLALIKRLRLHLGNLRRFHDQQLVRKSDLLETEARIEEQGLELEELVQTAEAEKLNFSKLCGYKIEDMEDDYREKISGYAQSFARFRKTNPVILSLNDRAEILRLQKSMVSGEYLPRLSGFAELHYGKPGIDFFKNDWALYFQGGLSIQLRVFDWNRKKRDLSRADYESGKIDNEKAEFVRNGEKMLRQLYDEQESANKRLEIMERLIRISLEDIELKGNLLAEQQISNVDYLETLVKREAYLSNREALKSRLQLIRVNVNKIIGKYEEE